VLEEELEVPEGAGLPALPSGQALRIVFENVGFHYNSHSPTPVLEEVNLTVEAGETVAILGATGSGKTTLIHLIPRFYDPTEGRILINGQDIRNVNQDSLLAAIGIVPQDTILFSGTVGDNIRYGSPDASNEQVFAAARAAQAHEFILGLETGYDTHVEERGVNLSGGQKQRIAIARALLIRPAVLILDDSTSSVDVETETKIQAALADWMQGRTCIVVAQRISTVLKADKIIVLEKGRILAQGTHRQLLKTSTIYQEIYASQLGTGINGV